MKMRTLIYIGLFLLTKNSFAFDKNETWQLSKMHAFALGVTQGVTEFLPVSSTGHMILVNDYFFKPSEQVNNLSDADTALKNYMICIQLGTIIALLLFYKKELLEIVKDSISFGGRGMKLGTNLIIAFIPTGAVGFLFGDLIQEKLYNRTMVVLAILFGGILIFFVEKSRKKHLKQKTSGTIFEISALSAFAIGLFQIVALWPGFSRSLSTIIGGICVGLTMMQAVNFSFLLGLLTTGVATVYKFLKSGNEMLSVLDVTSASIGILSAFVFGLATVYFFIKFLKGNGLMIFGIYRVVLAFILLALAT